MSHMGAVFQPIGLASMWLCVTGLTCSLSGLMGAAGGPGGPCCVTGSRDVCSQLQHCGPLQAMSVWTSEWRGSLPINIWGALVAAAVYLTEHAPGLPWRARHRGADSVTLSLTPLVLHPPSPSSLMGAALLPVPFPQAPSTLSHPSQYHYSASYLSTSVVTVIIFHLCTRVMQGKCTCSFSESFCCFPVCISFSICKHICICDLLREDLAESATALLVCHLRAVQVDECLLWPNSVLLLHHSRDDGKHSPVQAVVLLASFAWCSEVRQSSEVHAAFISKCFP